MSNHDFIEIAREYKNNEFPYCCSRCKTITCLKKRVTINKRSCPQCGHEITVNSIDHQVAAMMEERKGCLYIALTFFDTLFGGK